MKRFSIAVALLLFALPALAITYGQNDGKLHPNVGALVGEFDGGFYPFCSGALISPTVFLTAAHCNPGGTGRVYVTFAPDFDGRAKLIAGTFHGDPLYNWSQNDPHDIAVVVLDQPVKGVARARLPAAGSLGSLNGSQQFTAVGYGAQESPNVPGGPVMRSEGPSSAPRSGEGPSPSTGLRMTRALRSEPQPHREGEVVSPVPVVVLQDAEVLHLRVRLDEVEVELDAADQVAEEIAGVVAEIVVDVPEADAGADVRRHAREAADVDGQVEVRRAGGDPVGEQVFDVRIEVHRAEVEEHFGADEIVVLCVEVVVLAGADAEVGGEERGRQDQHESEERESAE
jgi:hypothetical protein